MKKELILGTAQWAWTIDRVKAFAILDLFYESGLRQIDCATNYPINREMADFRQAENILAEWTKINGVNDLQVIMKIGSINNLRTPDCNLSPSFLLMNMEYYRNLFGNNLRLVMVHWDNRDDVEAIANTIDSLVDIHRQGYDIGLSGIKYSKLYLPILKKLTSVTIQIKHNILQSDYERYVDFHQKATFIAYGVNAGGLKLDPAEYAAQSVYLTRGGNIAAQAENITRIKDILAQANKNTERPQLTSFFQAGMLHALLHRDISKVLIGPSSVEQLLGSIEFWKSAQIFDYSDVRF